MTGSTINNNNPDLGSKKIEIPLYVGAFHRQNLNPTMCYYKIYPKLNTFNGKI